MLITWGKDTRPKPDGHFATINRKKFPTVTRDDKVQRFPENRIIRDLLDTARNGLKLDLNEIVIRASKGIYCKEEMHEFYRLLGYSVHGFEEIFEDDNISSDLW